MADHLWFSLWRHSANCDAESKYAGLEFGASRGHHRSMPYQFEERDGVITPVWTDEDGLADYHIGGWRGRLMAPGRYIYRKIAKPEYLTDGTAINKFDKVSVQGDLVGGDGRRRYVEPHQQAILGHTALISMLIPAIFLAGYLIPGLEGPVESTRQVIFTTCFILVWLYTMGSGFAAISTLMNIRYQVYELDFDLVPDEPNPHLTIQSQDSTAGTKPFERAFDNAGDKPKHCPAASEEAAQTFTTCPDYEVHSPACKVFQKWQKPDYLENGTAIIVSIRPGAENDPYRYVTREQQKKIGRAVIVLAIAALILLVLIFTPLSGLIGTAWSAIGSVILISVCYSVVENAFEAWQAIDTQFLDGP